MLNDLLETAFVTSIDSVAEEINTVNEAHGFNVENPNKGEMIALMHSELSEAPSSPWQKWVRHLCTHFQNSGSDPKN